MQNQKIAVLVHGCHTGALGWENVVLGDPVNGQMGRVSKGLEVMKLLDADLLMIGTGASELNDLKEATAMQKLVLDYMEEGYGGYSVLDQLRLRKAVLDLESQNTPQECENALRYCDEKGIGRLIHVSSPFHATRCIDDMAKARKKLGVKVQADFVMSNTNPEGCSAQGTVVVGLPDVEDGLHFNVPEELHFAHQIKRIFPIFRTGKLPQFLGRLDELVDSCVNGQKVADVVLHSYVDGKVIVEQPHRGDDPQVKLPQKLHLASQVKRALPILDTDQAVNFLHSLDVLIHEYNPV